VATGEQRWVQRYNGPGDGIDLATSVDVSIDGTRAFVAGRSTGLTGTAFYRTLAYDAVTGNQLWVVEGPANMGSTVAITESPDGTTVFVTGTGGTPGNNDYVTVAYDAGTGDQRWLETYNGPGNNYDAAYAIAASPDGSRVFVTGDSLGTSNHVDMTTIAYDAATGAQLWGRRHHGGPQDCGSYGRSVVVRPDSSQVFVTGGVCPNIFATVAYDTTTGTPLWGKVAGDGTVASLAVSPDGSAVFVTGPSNEGASSLDYLTIAYSA
jgi:WD40 repeat protein